MRDIQSPDLIKKEYFTVSEVSNIIEEPTTVIHYWRTVFNVPAMRSKSFNHCWKFSRIMVAKFHIIKQLLRTEKYTIEGAKQKLK